MMNKKGTLVLRDVVFMMLIVSSVFVFAGLFVSDMATNYDNTNMSEEWIGRGLSVVSNTTFENTSSDMEATGKTINTGLFGLLAGGLKALGSAILMILNAPGVISTLVGNILVDVGVEGTAYFVIVKFINGILWALIGFTIWSAFLRGGKL